jgi:hypothetical protein
VPAATLVPVRAPDSTEGLSLLVTGRRSSIEADRLPAAANPVWSGRRQRSPFVLGVVVAAAFVAATVGYVRLVGSADRPTADRNLAIPATGPSRHEGAGPAAPSAGPTHDTGRSPGPPDGVVPSGTPDASAPPADVVATPTRPPTDPGRSPTAPDPAELTATVSTAKRLLPPGYVGQVIVSNEGGRTADGWTVSMSVGTHARVSLASGARFQQTGSVVTFVPEKGTRRIPQGESVRFAFRVVGLLAGRPNDCEVDGEPCQ